MKCDECKRLAMEYAEPKAPFGLRLSKKGKLVRRKEVD